MKLSSDQLAQIKAFVARERMVEAVKAALLDQVSPDGFRAYIASLDRALPDAEFGQQVKARAEAADILEESFAHLTQLASGKQGVQSQENQAR